MSIKNEFELNDEAQQQGQPSFDSINSYQVEVDKEKKRIKLIYAIQSLLSNLDDDFYYIKAPKGDKKFKSFYDAFKRSKTYENKEHRMLITSYYSELLTVLLDQKKIIFDKKLPFKNISTFDVFIPLFTVLGNKIQLIQRMNRLKVLYSWNTWLKTTHNYWSLLETETDDIFFSHPKIYYHKKNKKNSNKYPLLLEFRTIYIKEKKEDDEQLSSSDIKIIDQFISNIPHRNYNSQKNFLFYTSDRRNFKFFINENSDMGTDLRKSNDELLVIDDKPLINDDGLNFEKSLTFIFNNPHKFYQFKSLNNPAQLIQYKNMLTED